MIGHVVIAAYRPKPGKADELLELTRDHHSLLYDQHLVTARLPYIMRSKDGTIVEVFEWASLDAMDDAHTNPAALDLWEKYEALCEYVKLPELPESHDLFAGFASVD